jgi:hypothetical protein
MSILEPATERNSGTASTKPSVAASEPSNGDSFAHEAAVAKAAIYRAIDETRHSLATAVDVRLWTKKRPWIAIGLAATAGMAAAVFLRRGGRPAPPNAEPIPAGTNQQAASSKPIEPAHAGIGAAIAGSLFDLAKFGLETAIASGIRETAASRARQNACPNEPVPTEK